MQRIENISLILIARNEEFGIEKCLSSLARMDLHSCEVICVDSGSSDNTIGVMRKFYGIVQNLRIVRITGYSNAAVARNAGLRLATRDNIFFVDGDVEINPQFIVDGLWHLQAGAGAVTGKLRELQYSRDFKTVIKEIPDRFQVREMGRIFASGGCFLATRAATERTGLFDERLERSQDYDYTLRLSRRFTMLAIPVSMGTHHTVGYDDHLRLSTQIRKLHALFFGAVIRRNVAHLDGILWLLISRERGIALGGLLMIVGVIVIAMFGAAGAASLGGVIAVDFLWGFLQGSDLLYRFYLHYLFPILTLVGCLYIPDRRRPFTVEEVMF